MTANALPALSRRQLSVLLGTSLCCGTQARANPLPSNVTISTGDFLTEVEGDNHTLMTTSRFRASPNVPIMCWPVAPDTRKPRKDTVFNRIWLLQTSLGLRGYSVICQHAGCLVSDWNAQRHLLVCPCHGSAYDVDQGGRVVEGPAPLPLPFVPVSSENGYLRVAGVFSGHIGSHATRAD
ncbi:QcrA and Rieske domain-containing protein [Acetobacter conturbans]|uniref:Rieske 2Fe-2S domain-containing protein n=1 Tax=Acetobacter conturbans TaxID=1737472 RepID=A0ABX0JWC3_9PROT|nr:Rieske 2Fe-2S domain-containing protein [Acetobacter conturbans]NHN87692.1 Rieske 2Fe-2S domain-containing protein [Acetobacter conturbans]